MNGDLMSVVIALGIAGASVLICSIGLGVLLIAWGSYVAWGLPASVVVTAFYLRGGMPPLPRWPWKQA